jgi:peptide/nickel transport system permease protein
MSGYLLRRLLQFIPLLLFLSIGLFALVNLAPGGPLASLGGARHVNPQRAEQLRRQLGLDQPLPLQYVYWLLGNDWTKVDADGDGIAESAGNRKGILRGDFGTSFRTRQPVLGEILQRLPNTVYLMAVTLIVVGLIAIPVGVISAVRQYSAFDLTATTFSFAGQAIPEFWLGLVLIMVFYVWLHNPVTGEPLLPSGGMHSLGVGFSLGDWIKHLILPVSMGAVGWVAWYTRFLRAGMLDVLSQDYIRTARAKGLKERTVLYRHALRNALLPVLTLFALDLPYVFAGSLYVELIFSWPGMGRLYYQSAVERDYPLLMAILIITAGVTALCNLLADLGYAVLDPRIRYE